MDRYFVLINRCPVLLIDFPVGAPGPFDRDVAHSRIARGTMPVPGARRDRNNITRRDQQFLGLSCNDALALDNL